MSSHPSPHDGPARRGPASVLVRRADLGDVAWQVLLRDGHLVALRDDVALPRRVAATPLLRAAALAPLVPARCAVGRTAAAWVHLGGPAPARVHVVATRRDRVPAPHPERTTSAADLTARDVVVLAGVRVTTPRRTARDLLTDEPPGVALPLLARLRDAGLDLAAVRSDVAAAAGRRGVRQAARALQDLRPLRGVRP
ncbi:hypothetical protein [Cellulomonas endometrii]|uniref:hypothetical protein n=1 Tax=Cellulomonas endometrii TaxID=3036301 RepID=UPI0024ACEBDD|nr:hypothetical protein [Cellulomonas endometrii]